MQTFKSVAHWYFSRSALPYWGILAIDCLIVAFTMVAPY